MGYTRKRLCHFSNSLFAFIRRLWLYPDVIDAYHCETCSGKRRDPHFHTATRHCTNQTRQSPCEPRHPIERHPNLLTLGAPDQNKIAATDARKLTTRENQSSR